MSADTLSCILNGQIISGEDELIDINIPPFDSHSSSNYPSLPPIINSSVKDNSDNLSYNRTKAFERLSLAIRVKALKSWPSGSDLNKYLDPDRVTRGIARPKWLKLIDEVKEIEGSDLKAATSNACKISCRPKNCLQGKAALNIIGCKIIGDLDLSGLHVDFPINIICCWITGTLILDRSQFDSLDLFGSIFEGGISANSVCVRNAFRMRRSVSLGPISFGGSEFKSIFDGTEMVALPKNLPSPNVHFSGEYGILNLGLCHIEKEVRLMRSRIYGGINLRGSTIGGSIFLTDALIRSPWASLLRRVCQIVKLNSPIELNPLANAILFADHILAAKIWTKKDTADIARAKFCMKIERLGDNIFPLTRAEESEDDALNCLFALLSESGQRGYSSIRAEGLKVNGNLFAQRAKFLGQIRLKYASLGQSFNLSGARISSAERIIKSLNAIFSQSGNAQISQHPNLGGFSQIKKFYNRCSRLHKKSEHYVCAINLQEAKIGGSFKLNKNAGLARESEYSKVVLKALGGINQGSVRNSNNELIDFVVHKFCETREDPHKLLHYFHRNEKNPRAQRDILIERKSNKEPLSEKERDFLYWTKILRHHAIANDEEFYKHMPNPFLPEEHIDNINAKNHAYEKDGQNLPYARMYTPYNEQQINDLAFATKLGGEIISPIISGKLNLERISVGGNLNFNGLFFNIFEDDPISYLILDDAKIEGNADFRSSIGLRNIRGRRMHIGNSLMFARFPKLDPEFDLWKPIDQRAIFFSKNKDWSHFKEPDLKKKTIFHLILNFIKDTFLLNDQRFDLDEEQERTDFELDYSKYDFEDTVIAGNACFVFDQRNGPSLDLANTHIKGRLSILPMIGGIELNKAEFEDIIDHAKSIRNRGRVGFWSVPKYVINRLRKVVKESNRKRTDFAKFWATLTIAEINLNSARCTEFAHPPSAWPLQDGLRIQRFLFERSLNCGPLPPLRQTWSNVYKNLNHNYIVLFPIGVTASLLFLALVMWHLYYPQPIMTHFDTLDLSSLFFLGSVFMFFLIDTLIFWGTKPKYRSVKPAAIHWLNLQRRRLNLRRIFDSINPWEPYTRAARVLRADGSQRSANSVELERLRKRRQAMSMRSTWPLVIVLILTDKILGYGFRPARTLKIFTAIIALGVFCCICFDNNNFVRATDYNRMRYAQSQFDVTYLKNEKALPLLPSEAPVDYPVFEPVLYCFDLFIPFLDLDQEDYWTVQDPDYKNGEEEGYWPLERSFFRWHWFPPLYKMIGWLLSTLVAVSVITRFETILTRNEE